MLKRILVLVAIACPSMTHAQNAAEAEELFQEGRRLLAAGRVAEACNVLDASYKADPNVSTLVNLAMCRDRNGQLATAWAHFVAVANQTAGRRDKATLHARSAARAAEIEPRLSYLIVNVPDTSRIDGLVVTRDGVELDPGAWNRSLPVDGGTYVIAGKAPGHEAWSTKVVVARESDRKSVDVPRFHELAPVAPAPQPVTVDDEQSEEEVEAPAMPEHARWRRPVAIGLAVSAGVAVIGAIALDASARSRYGDATHQTDIVQRSTLYESAVARRYAAQIVGGLGVGCAATAVVLWLLDRTHPSPVAASITTNELQIAWSGVF